MRALWSSRQNSSHNVSQKLKRIRRFSEKDLGEGSSESKIAAGQWGVNLCREAFRCLARPSVRFSEHYS